MTVYKNIDVIRDMIRRYMLQTEFQTASCNIDDEWPLEIAVAISAHKDNRHPDRPQLVQNCFCADVAEMPDLVSAFCHLLHILRQAIMRVGENENAPSFFGICLHSPSEFELSTR